MMQRQAKVNRTDVVIAAGIGLLLGALIAALGLIARQVWLPAALFPQSLIAWVMFLMLGAFSLAEIPVMIFGIRKMTESGRPTTLKVALFTVGAFVTFAAVYALPNLLLTSSRVLWMGATLTALTLLRFAASVLFLGK